MDQNDSNHLIFLNIADFIIQIKTDTEFTPEPGYELFFTDDKQTTDFVVNCKAGIPADIFAKKKPVFEAENEQQKFYDIYRHNEGLGFVIYNQQQKNTIQQIALLDKEFRNWTIYASDIAEFNPLRYPMGPIIMHYMTIKTNSVMMHASCAFDGQRGRMFSGFSGVGKSTMSRIWAEAGSTIINDDRLIIRELGNKFFVYNTPMYYKDIPKKAPLNAIYLIHHSPENKIQKLKGALAASRTMAFCIQNNYDRSFVAERIGFFARLAAAVDIYDLGFVPNASVIEFIKAHE